MENATCKVCCRPIGMPYRVYDGNGRVIHGCIDDSHTGKLIVPSESSFWHNRRDAKIIRIANRRNNYGPNL